MIKTKIYFAHPLNVYNTALESALEILIRRSIPEYEIESPSKSHHQKGYEEWKANTAINRDKHNAMAYFYEIVIPQCVGCVSLPFLDRRMGLGVNGETKKTIERGDPAWFLIPTRMAAQKDIDDFIANPKNGLFIIRKFTEDEIQLILSEDPLICVSHQETRLRTFFIYNGPMRPYAEAHLVQMPVPEGFYPDN
ncbi:MAG: hypothetical protein AAB461_03145 [Patescibacteria group bacterium]